MSIKIIQENPYPLYSNNSNKSSKLLFEARKKFQSETIPALLFSINNFNSNLLADQRLFGCIDVDGDYVFLKDESYLKSVSRDNQSDNYLQDFVADAFLDLKNYLKKMILIGKISKDSPYADINVKLSHRNVVSSYITNQITLLNDFKAVLKSNTYLNSQIYDHKHFNKEFIKFLSSKAVSVPVTLSETIPYFNMIYLNSGLLLSLSSKDDAGNDALKYDKYFNAAELECFHESCKRFGFTIDINVPWILLADINSPAMTKYLNKYKLTNAKDMLEKRFSKGYLYDIDNLKNNFYNSYVDAFKDLDRPNIDTRNLEYNSGRELLDFQRRIVSQQKYFQEFNDLYWIKLYVYFRNIETKRGFTQQEFENVCREAYEAYRNGYKNDCAEFINKFFKGYGSLYIKDPLQQYSSMIDTEDGPVGQPTLPQIILF